jgi:hypothetical protein
MEAGGAWRACGERFEGVFLLTSVSAAVFLGSRVDRGDTR